MHTGSTQDTQRMRAPLVRVDGRTRGARRLRDLADSYADALGGWTKLMPLQAHAVRRAAELSTLAEQARASALETGTVDPVALSQLEGKAERAVRGLGLPDGKTEAAAPSLPSVPSSVEAMRAYREMGGR